MGGRWYIVNAPKTSVFSNPKETPSQADNQEVALAADSIMSGNQTRHAREKGRNRTWDKTPAGKHSKLKRDLRYRLKKKVRKAALLEKELVQYEQKISNRTGKS